MSYQMTGFIQKYFKRYMRTYLKDLDADAVTEIAQIRFDQLMQLGPDMGGKDNMMASNVDLTAAFFAYHEASDKRIGGEAIEILIGWLAEDLKWVGFFTDMNKRKYVRPLYYKVYSKHAAEVERHKEKGEWRDTWSFAINPDNRQEGIYYHMIGCPLYKFVKDIGYAEMMPYVCKFDFIFEKFLHARLIRTQTEAAGGSCCDYWFVGDQSETAREYKDFVSK